MTNEDHDCGDHNPCEHDESNQGIIFWIYSLISMKNIFIFIICFAGLVAFVPYRPFPLLRQRAVALIANHWNPPMRYPGLTNLGQSCYVNVILQSFYFIPLVRRAVSSLEIQGPIGLGHDRRPLVTPINRHRVNIFTLQKLFYDMATRRVADPGHFLHSYNIDPFHAGDPHETFVGFLNSLRAATNDAALLQLLQWLFQGAETQSVVCERRNLPNPVPTIQLFEDLFLDVTGQDDIMESLRFKYQDVNLRGRNCFNYPGIGPVTATMHTRITQLPRILCINLKRFEFDRHAGQARKIYQRFEFPESLDLAEFAGPGQHSTQYHLMAVFTHTGRIAGGHYHCFLSNPTPLLHFRQLHGPGAYPRTWFQMNDQHVTPATRAQAIDGNFGINRANLDVCEATPTAYRLMYVNAANCEEIFENDDSHMNFPHSFRQAMRQFGYI